MSEEDIEVCSADCCIILSFISFTAAYADVGFDVRGDVKLFDFGLAKFMPSTGNPYEDKFDMSGAGSPRYMSPEVLDENPVYNLKADVYTFSMVLWEILALEKPFSDIKHRRLLIDFVGTCVVLFEAHISTRVQSQLFCCILLSAREWATND